jgi:hypothetical protein
MLKHPLSASTDTSHIVYEIDCFPVVLRRNQVADEMRVSRELRTAQHHFAGLEYTNLTYRFASRRRTACNDQAWNAMIVRSPQRAVRSSPLQQNGGHTSELGNKGFRDSPFGRPRSSRQISIISSNHFAPACDGSGFDAISTMRFRMLFTARGDKL